MKGIFTLTILVLAAVTAGCSINHPVAKDYDQYLAKYGAEKTLPKSELESEYVIASQTMEHNYQFRAATVGYAHVWIVEFGKILDKTISSNYVQSAFGKLDKRSGDSAEGDLIEFELENFEFKNYHAYTTLVIKVRRDGKEVFSKKYQSEGRNQGGQMWAAGPFGMKNATLKSTKSSIDRILEQFINDINNNELLGK